MKKLQQLSVAVILTLLISVSAFAADGVIWPMRTEPTPPPPPVMATNNPPEAEGIIQTWATSSDTPAEVMLSLLPSVLALF